MDTPQHDPAGRHRADPQVLESERPSPAAAERRRFRIRSRYTYGIVGLFMLLALLYGIDLVTSVGRVPRGTEVAGVDVGGMKLAEAEQKLQTELGPRADGQVALRAGAVSTSLDPKSVGLQVDWPGTLDRAGEQPLNPFTRLASFFVSHDVGIASIIPDQRLTAFLEKLSSQADFGPREGNIWFDRDQVRSVIPMDGQKLKLEPSRDAVLGHWLDQGGVELPVDYTKTDTDPNQVRDLVRTVAEPAVGRPLDLVASTVGEDGKEPPVTTMSAPPPPAPAAPSEGGAQPPAPAPVVLVDPANPQAVKVPFPRDRMGEYLSFVRHGNSLEPKFDAEAAKGLLQPLVESTETQGKDASFEFSGDSATVVPAVKGRTVDWGPLLAALPDQLKNSGGLRLVPVGYRGREPELSTDDATKAGIRSKVGEFTMAVGASSSAQNMLAQLNGRYIKAGSTFSLAGLGLATSGDRGADAVATALFNAAYEAGAQNLQRTQRSAADRAFPGGRDASAASEVAFTDSQRTGLVIEAYGTGSAVTVRLWGTREYSVSTSTTPRTDVRNAENRVSTASGCTPSEGEQGYSVVVSRTVRRGNDTVSTDSFRSTYAPSPGVTCQSAPDRGPGGGTGTSRTSSPDEPESSPSPAPPAIQIPGLPPIVIPGVPAR